LILEIGKEGSFKGSFKVGRWYPSNSGNPLGHSGRVVQHKYGSWDRRPQLLTSIKIDMLEDSENKQQYDVHVQQSSGCARDLRDATFERSQDRENVLGMNCVAN